jgi:hypothetical protein
LAKEPRSAQKIKSFGKVKPSIDDKNYNGDQTENKSNEIGISSEEPEDEKFYKR